jgi:para-nitrobenzyl esterase
MGVTARGILMSVLQAFLPIIAVVAAGSGSAPVRIESGLVSGVVSDGILSYKGIPYAAPPVGDLRWRAPQPPAQWPGVRPSDHYAHDCMQEPFPSDAAPLGTSPDEDCLYLNVWAPASRGSKALPVMVWFHGGGFINGGSSPAVYDGSHFARRGIVFVSFNYRLGRFGFFAHPALSAEAAGDPTANYGFLDQIAVLRWVKRNAAAFGGDPGNVTIFGESAGGGSVNAMVVSPLARGLFHKVLVESGAGRSRGPITMRSAREPGPKKEPSGEAIGVAFAEQAGIKGRDPAALAALRKLPATSLVNGMNLANPQPDTFAGPMVDGKIVPGSIEDLFRAGKQARVPYLIGANALEFGFAPVPPKETEDLLAPLGADRGKVLAAYDPEGHGDMGEIGMRLRGDLAMVEPARLLARLTSAAGQPTWVYRFSYVASTIRSSVRGALHATEIPFVFATVREKYGAATTPEDEAVAEAMNGYWAAFSRGGDPNQEARPRWPGFTAAGDLVMEFGSGPPVATPDPWKARLDFAERLSSVPRP